MRARFEPSWLIVRDELGTGVARRRSSRSEPGQSRVRREYPARLQFRGGGSALPAPLRLRGRVARQQERRRGPRLGPLQSLPGRPARRPRPDPRDRSLWTSRSGQPVAEGVRQATRHQAMKLNKGRHAVRDTHGSHVLRSVQDHQDGLPRGAIQRRETLAYNREMELPDEGDHGGSPRRRLRRVTPAPADQTAPKPNGKE